MRAKWMKLIKYFVMGIVFVPVMAVGLFFINLYFPVAQLYYLKITSKNIFQQSESNYAFSYKKYWVVGKYELGEIALSTGEKVKFWFASHHETLSGKSYTIFELPNGEKKLMLGYFCCEVDVPSEAIINIASFKEFIKTNDGIRP